MANATSDKSGGRTLCFDSFEEYEAWRDENPHELEPTGKTAEDLFWDVADLSDAINALNPYEQEHFVASFESFDEYEAWKNAQTNPRHW